jgi:hypothetical protein
MSVNYAVQDFAYIVPKQTLKKQPGILLAPRILQIQLGDMHALQSLLFQV